MDDIRKKIEAAQAARFAEAKRSHKTERREFPRFELACPTALYRGAIEAQSAWARSRTDNISNGGCYVTVIQTADIKPGSMVRLDLKIPRQTPNTYMLEPYQTDAFVVRVEPGGNVKSSVSTTNEATELGLALKFINPLELSLE